MLRDELAPYLRQARRRRRCFKAYLDTHRPQRRSRTIDFLVELNQRLQQRHRAT